MVLGLRKWINAFKGVPIKVEIRKVEIQKVEKGEKGETSYKTGQELGREAERRGVEVLYFINEEGKEVLHFFDQCELHMYIHEE